MEKKKKTGRPPTNSVRFLVTLDEKTSKIMKEIQENVLDLEVTLPKSETVVMCLKYFYNEYMRKK